MLYRVLLIWVFMAGAALAAPLLPDRVMLQIGSHHINMTPDQEVGAFVETNPGVIFVWDRGRVFNPAAGVFRNSYGGTSPMVGFSSTFLERNELSIGGFGALAYYGDDAAYVHEELAGIGIVPFFGLQFNYRNLYVQAVPVVTKADGVGSLIVYGLRFDL